MNVSSLASCALAVVVGFGSSLALASEGPAGFHRAAAGHWVAEVRVPGADGTALQTLVYLPAEGRGPWPTLITRSPYDLPMTPVSGFPEEHANAGIEADEKDIGWTEATDRGYALVIQFMRGRNESDGTFSLFVDERADGEALVRWVEGQPWSNGRLGVFGDSASGVAALQAAAVDRPSIRAIYAQATSPDFLGGVIFPERAIKWEALLPFVLNQSLENSADHEARLGLDAPAIELLKNDATDALGEMFGALESGDASTSGWWTSAPTADLPVVSDLQPRWSELLAARTQPRVLAANDVRFRLRAPLLQVGLWHDFFHDSAIDTWTQRRFGADDDRLIMLDGTHYDVDDGAIWPIRPMFAWFDHWLKGAATDVPRWPRVQFAWAGEGVASTIGSDRWPLETRTTVLDLVPPAAPIAIDATRPVPTLGGNHLIAPSGMLDQRPLLPRADVGMLRGPVLRTGLPIAGEVGAVLRLKRPAEGPLVVKLVDIRADGEVRLVREQLIPAVAGRWARVHFASIGYRFAAGSRPGLIVQGSSFPAWVVEGAAPSRWIDIASARLTLPDASSCRCGNQPPRGGSPCRLSPSAAPDAVCRAP